MQRARTTWTPGSQRAWQASLCSQPPSSQLPSSHMKHSYRRPSSISRPLLLMKWCAQHCCPYTYKIKITMKGTRHMCGCQGNCTPPSVLLCHAADSAVAGPFHTQ